MTIRALVIDDSKVMRSMVMQSLQKTRLADFEFIEAQDGADALEKFDPDEIDIVFADWNMPNMSGIDFVREVRAMDGTEHIPIVMVTSEKSMGKVETAIEEAGANEYICKPFTVEQLERKLSKLLAEIAESAKGSGGFFGKMFST
jgi:two-component system chemotaxis response regulator CheY